MIRIARKSVYLLEFYDDRARAKYTEDGWIYNYPYYCKQFNSIEIIPIPSEFQKKGRWPNYSKLIKIEKEN